MSAIGSKAEQSIKGGIQMVETYEVIMEARAGSHLYGTNRPESDEDFRGVALAPVASLVGLGPAFEQHIETKLVDRTIWEIRKFVHLALANNPNILDTLFTPPELWIVSTPAWQSLYELRHDVLSQRVRKTYAGYAVSQLRRIEGHMKWLLDPPEKPYQNEYGKFIGSTWHWNDKEAERIYRAEHKRWDEFTQWSKNRNAARHDLEVKYEYDTKHASHLWRLVLQAKSILATGNFSPVLNPRDLAEVKHILSGGLRYGELIQMADEHIKLIDTMLSDLPDKPREDRLDALVQSLYIEHIKKGAS